ncbi:MAG: translocation/assembly module TamB [Bacteroidales bacterium]|nr:translocation/assembly module TamB [Bacteroidales bacterium]
MLTVLIALIMTVFLLLRDSRVQSFAAQLAADYLSTELGTTIRIGGIDLSIRNGVVIENILVKDNCDTTLFAARELGIKPIWLSLTGRNISVQKILISQGEFQLIKHQGDSLLNLVLLINHFASKDTVAKVPDTIPSAPFKISCNNLELEGIRFHYQDNSKSGAPDGMDYTNIDVRDINLDVSHIRIEGDSMNARINRLSARERSGINLHEFEGDVKVCDRYIEVDNLKLITDNSNLSLDFAFRYNGFIAFTDFLKRVTIEAEIQPSEFDMTDIGFFAPEVKTMTNRFQLQGKVAGTVSKFTAKNLEVEFGENTVFKGNIFAVGLPDVMATYVDMKINQFTSSATDIGSFRIPGDSGILAIPAMIDNLGLINVKGEFTGFVDDFISRAEIRTGIGAATTNLQLKQPKGGLLDYKGELRITSFNLGALIDEKEVLGYVTLRANLDGKGTSLANADLLMQVHVDSALINGYTYKNVAINGSMIRKKFFGDVSVDDPNLELTFHGMADANDSVPVFNFSAVVGHAQLFNLHLLERDSTEIFSASIDADFKGSNIDNIDGTLSFHNISYWEGRNRAVIDSVMIKTNPDSSGLKAYEMRSDFADAEFTGEFTFSKLVPSVITFIQNYLASFEMRSDSTRKYHYSGQELNYHIAFKKSADVTAIFLPFLEISPGSYLEGSYSEAEKILSLKGRSPILHVRGMKMKDWYFDAETHIDNLSLQTGCDQMIMNQSKPTDSTYIQLDTLSLIASIRRDSILYKLNSSSGSNHSYFKGFLTFLEDGSVKIKLDELDLKLNNNNWSISKENYVIFDTALIVCHDITFSSGNQWLSLNGRIAHHDLDTLDLRFNGVDVSQLDYFLANPNIDLDGILSGSLKITDVYNQLSIFSDLKLDNFSFNKQHLGDAVFHVNYNRTEQKFDVLSEIIYTGNIGQNIPFSLTGSVFTTSPDPRFDFDLKLKNLNLKMLGPFVSSFMSKLSGLASGEVKISGTINEPVFQGKLNLMRTEFKINYLNVPYSLSDIIDIEPNKIAFNNIVLYDSLGNKAFLNGSVNHNYFKDIMLDLAITMDDFSAFKNTYAQNTTFYGNARASGSVVIKGPPDNISVGVTASTGSNTHVTIPISLTQSVGQVDYIVFKQSKEDSLENIAETLRNRSSSGLTLALDLNVSPDAQVEVLFPDQLGNIKATGSGSLSMGMTPITPFSLHGSYSINKGSFLFQMKNLIRMPFDIKEGSSISWSGDPADATISLSAIYKTKVPLAGLSSETSNIQGRIPVECIIRLNGKLMNPIMSFGMALPNAQENERALVFNSIDTNNTAEMTQQVLYILVMNQFKPVAGGSGGSVDVGGTSMAIVTNQINSWLSGMTQNLNIGVNYKPGSATSSQDIDMTVSTQLFNDRLLIDGTFGMSSYKNTTSAQASTIVGDINVEYILTKNRRWRIRAFNRTNTIDLLNNNAPYTQGVGISFQRDFYTWVELFKKSTDKEPKSKEPKSE